MGLHERREELRERLEERREAHHERREERHHRHDQPDYYSGNREGDQYGRGGYAAQGYGAQPPYGSDVSQTGGRGYNPGYISQDSNLYRNDDYESNNRQNAPSATQVHGYGTGGAYARPHDSTNEKYSSAYTPSHPTGAPFGTPGLDSGRGPTTYGSSHSPREGYETDSNAPYGGHPSGGPGHRGDAEYSGPNPQYGGSGYGAPQGYNSAQGRRDEGETYGRIPPGPLGPGTAAGGYASGEPRREGVEPGIGNAGRDPSYDTPQSYGGPRRGDDRDEYGAKSASYNAPQSYGGSRRNDEDRNDYHGSKNPGYDAPPRDGVRHNAEDRDQYSGTKSSGYGPPESQYGANMSASSTPRPHGGPRRGDGDEYSSGATQYSAASAGTNAPAGGFLSGSGDAASTRDDERGPTKDGYSGRDSRPGPDASKRRGNYDSSDAPHSSYEGKPTGYDDGHRRDEDTYSGTPAHGRPQRNDDDDDDDARAKRHQQSLDAHTQMYGSGTDSNARADPDVLGAAAAVEALKLTAAGKQSQAGGRPGGRRPNANDDDAEYSNAPAGGLGSNRPAGGRKPSYDDEDEEDASPAPTSTGSSMQDKIVSLAMAQAGKLFDKKNGGSGDSSGKSEAMQTAAASAMKLCADYKTTGKLNLQPGEMQKLVGAAMSLF
ncbi:hypothetical protein EDC04DRAFT_2785628 [Pisolithus marmoratus]|nr:hypothetical protein EDC04DRAFT_2785628 [Pisolithus marmoratus]